MEEVVLETPNPDYAEVLNNIAVEMEKAVKDGDSAKLSLAILKLPKSVKVSQLETKKAESLLHLAAKLGYFKCARVLVYEGKVPVNISQVQNKNQPIHYSSANGHEAAMVFFIENGADIECRNANGETPLHLVANAEKVSSNDLYLNCIDRLVDLRANVNITDNCKYTPLHKAAQRGRVDVVKRLLHLKA